MLAILAGLLALPMLMRGPAVVGVGPDRATIAWQATEPGPGATVRFGTSAGVYLESAHDPGQTAYHRVQLGGLQPSTTYHYAVDGDANHEDSRFTTAPPPSVVSRVPPHRPPRPAARPPRARRPRAGRPRGGAPGAGAPSRGPRHARDGGGGRALTGRSGGGPGAPSPGHTSLAPPPRS